MEITFKDPALAEIDMTGTTKSSRYKKFCRNKELVAGYQRAVAIMRRELSTASLSSYSFLHYEKLKYRNESSVRIMNGAVERLIFTENENGIEVELIEIDSKHYGNKR